MGRITGDLKRRSNLPAPTRSAHVLSFRPASNQPRRHFLPDALRWMCLEWAESLAISDRGLTYRRQLAQLTYCLFVQLQTSRGDIFFQMPYAGCAWNGQNHWRS